MEVGGREFRKWENLIPDALTIIFNKLSLKENLTVIPRVCKAWRKAVEGPYCWQEIDIERWSAQCRLDQLVRMLWLLIPRTQGLLRKLHVSCVDNDESFAFIAQHAESLQTLKLRRSKISDSIVVNLADKFPALTTLDVSLCTVIGARAFEAIGKNCKSLTSLNWSLDPRPNACHADGVRTIAKTMPKLRKLELINHHINGEIVLEILANCPELEFLDLRGCLSVHLDDKYLEMKHPKVEVLGLHSRSTSDSDDDWYRFGCYCDYFSGDSDDDDDDDDDDAWDEAYAEYLL